MRTSPLLLALGLQACSPATTADLSTGKEDGGAGSSADGGADGASADGGGDGGGGAEGAEGGGSDGGNSEGGDEGGGLVTDEEVEELPSMSEDSELLFDESRIPELYIGLSDAAIAVLERERQWDEHQYVEATLELDGVVYGPIGLRMKGENSWRPFTQKVSLKMDFNRYEGGPDRVLGLKGLTLQAMNEDYSMMHERVGYRVYREMGVPAVRAHHAAVYINGEYYGLFTMLDSVNDQFLARWFTDTTGPMWEQHDGDFVDSDIYDTSLFQLEEGTDDRSGLQAVADALESGGADALTEAGLHLDWTAFLNYWAAGSLVMQFDAYPFRFRGDDCHIYQDPSSGLLVYIPHGVDEAFYSAENFVSMSSGLYTGGHLSARCMEVEECRAEFATRVYEGLELMETLDIAGYAEEVRDQIEAYIELEPNAAYSARDTRNYQADMIDKLTSRRSNVERFLDDPR
jgi:hypothetical protein